MNLRRNSTKDTECWTADNNETKMGKWRMKMETTILYTNEELEKGACMFNS